MVGETRERRPAVRHLVVKRGSNPWTIWSGRGECGYCFDTVISTTYRGLKASDPAGHLRRGELASPKGRDLVPLAADATNFEKLRKLSGGLP
jgi:hypothetical protein